MLSSIIVIIAKHKHHCCHYQHFYLVHETYFAAVIFRLCRRALKRENVKNLDIGRWLTVGRRRRTSRASFATSAGAMDYHIAFNIILGIWSFQSQPSHIIIISLIIGIVQIEKYSLPPSSAIITTIVIIVVSSSNNSIIIVNNFHQISTFSGKSSKKFPAFVVKVRHEVAVAMEEQIYPRHFSILEQSHIRLG